MAARTKSIAIIACDHGYGHIRRALLIAVKLAALKWQVYLLAPEEAVKSLKRVNKLSSNLKIIDFKAGIEAKRVKKGEASGWIKRLPSLDEFDVVLSDNLVEILEVREDAILSGSFLWHRVLEGIDQNYYQSMEELLEIHRPRLIASELFATDSLTRYTRFYPVGLYAADPVPQWRNQGDNLLISCGMSQEAETEYRLFLDHLAFEQKPAFETVWVEPRLLPKEAPIWMQAATYNADMYKGLKAAICRPGVGTLTDCLWGGAHLFCYHENGNKEMMQNANAIYKAGVGESFLVISEAYKAAFYYYKDTKKQGYHLESLRKISFEGVNETAEILKNIKIDK